MTSDAEIEANIRRSITGQVESMTDVAGYLRVLSFTSFFENFYGWIPHRADRASRGYAAGKKIGFGFTPAKVDALKRLSHVVDDACDAMPNDMDADAFLKTAWPERIETAARAALAALRTP